jgi:GT2 family glycosyltransferase
MYNASKYIREAIDSILDQTYSDFELIIIDDGSSDESAQIVSAYTDQRVILVKQPKSGLVKALNQGLRHARGNFIARMDGDDRSHPARFEGQLSYFAKYPDTDILCTEISVIDENGQRDNGPVAGNIDSDMLRDGLLFRRSIKPVVHPSVMMKRSVIETVGEYREYEASEDHDFWLRAVDACTIRRIRRALLEYRIHAGGTSSRKRAIQLTNSALTAVNYIVEKRTHVDLYSQNSTLLIELQGLLTTLLTRAILPASAAFEDAKQCVRAGKMGRAIFKLGSAMTKYGCRLRPSVRNALTGRYVDAVASVAQEALCRNTTIEDMISNPTMLRYPSCAVISEGIRSGGPAKYVRCSK